MTCPICNLGQTQTGTTIIALERHGATIVIRNVPAEVCDACGEAYVDEAVTSEVLREAERAAARGPTLEVREYAA